ncbi:serine/threonine-protein kinase [Leptolyngbya sp. FACHB-261]|uniref:serine/threonine protein kinase n=1 Tax=Leptolyngbya sp. FACHB-261 TaxID=2692806 RepID=UPI0016896B8B|nr:serine/threonine-protein kinase [Leptolyngbya sp. FACHB-261]MBD2104779.1 serine/threonine protein kinase [Leptolyngbya sp. FACHB-261]
MTDKVLKNRYRLLQPLGQNAGRQTWLAEDLQTIPQPAADPAEDSADAGTQVPSDLGRVRGELVVVKLLSFGPGFSWDDLKLFERESRILQALDHPSIPRYRDYFSTDSTESWGFCLVKDYIPGESLSDRIRQGRLYSETEAIELAEGLLEILIYLHGRTPPVIHRDIKPSNVLIGENGRLHLVDFGAVQNLAVVEGQTITIVGTYGYMPPEQFGGRTVAASDLYALGATLVHALTGRSPSDLPQRNLQLQFERVVSLSPGFTQWLHRLLDPSLDSRLSSAHQALSTLRAAQVFGSEPAATEQTTAEPRNRDQPLSNRMAEVGLNLPGIRDRIDQLDQQQPGAKREAIRIFRGWEERRPLFNLVVFLPTLSTLLHYMGSPGEMLFSLVFWGLTANICYFLGPCIESYLSWLGLRPTWLRNTLFVSGSLLSLLVTLAGLRVL